jgi:hypothetical protein
MASFTIFAVSSIISESSMPGTILSNGKAVDYLSSATPVTPCNFGYFLIKFPEGNCLGYEGIGIEGLSFVWKGYPLLKSDGKTD